MYYLLLSIILGKQYINQLKYLLELSNRIIMRLSQYFMS